MSIIHVARNGSPLGTFSETEIKQGLGTGQFLLSDLGWRSGMPQWKALGEWGEFAPILQPMVSIPVPGAPLIVEPAWERRAELGEWRAFWQTARCVLFTPSKVFSSLSQDGNIGGSFLFYVIPAMVMTILGQVISMVTGLEEIIKEVTEKYIFERLGYDYAQYLAEQAEQMEKMPASAKAMMQAFQIGGAVVGTVLGVLLGIFISAAIAHLMLMIVRGAKRPFATTFKAVSYTYGSLAFFTWIPVIGPVIGITYGSIVEIIALARAHGISLKRSAASVLLPILAGFCCLVTVFGAMHFGLKEMNYHIRPYPGHTPAPTSLPTPPPDSNDDDSKFTFCLGQETYGKRIL
ncbi:MAG: YIP1 family protein [Puniceicoccales bacterium]|jgi:hypothetical protein|nr:YIP1 family protein [Puniceicoccales bacterium]